jgi:hypothetical protein
MTFETGITTRSVYGHWRSRQNGVSPLRRQRLFTTECDDRVDVGGPARRDTTGEGRHGD